MILPGLVSITFRQLAPREIVALAATAQLRAIEWGGDVHVPHGDTRAAREVRQLTEQAGLQVAAYGSYFRFRPGEAFEPVLETAVALGAPLVRVWAGERPSAEAGASYREALATEARRLAELAASAGIDLAYEFHGGSLTDTLPSALELLGSAQPMKTLWQPPHDISDDQRIEGLQAVLPWLANIHVFTWRGPRRERRPLAEGAALWRRAFDLLAATGRDHAALLEFVADDDPRQLARDAATLCAWLAQPSQERDPLSRAAD